VYKRQFRSCSAMPRCRQHRPIPQSIRRIWWMSTTAPIRKR